MSVGMSRCSADLVTQVKRTTNRNNIATECFVLKWFCTVTSLSVFNWRDDEVRLNGVLSEPVSVASRVPQGSVLGPLLFLIYVIYDIPCFSKVFADDTKLYLGYSRVVS